MHVFSKLGIYFFVSGVVMTLAGLGFLISPFYLPGGVVGFLNGDRPMNQSTDRAAFEHMFHSCASLLIGLVQCVAGPLFTALGLGVFVGGTAAGGSKTVAIPAEIITPPENLSPPPSS